MLNFEEGNWNSCNSKMCEHSIGHFLSPLYNIIGKVLENILQIHSTFYTNPSIHSFQVNMYVYVSVLHIDDLRKKKFSHSDLSQSHLVWENGLYYYSWVSDPRHQQLCYKKNEKKPQSVIWLGPRRAKKILRRLIIQSHPPNK